MKSEDPSQLDRSTQLAFQRTWLAEERTLLAWTRTATSLITFGFAIFSFFGMSSGPGHEHASQLGSRIFAISLMGIGLIALLAAAVQRREAVQVMKSMSQNVPTRSAAGIVATLVGVSGLLALVFLLSRT